MSIQMSVAGRDADRLVDLGIQKWCARLSETGWVLYAKAVEGHIEVVVLDNEERANANPDDPS